MKKFLNLILALGIAVVMSGCGASGEVYEGDGSSSQTDIIPPNNNANNDYNNDIIYNDTDDYDYDDIYSDTDEDFGYNNNYDTQSIDIYDLNEGDYVIKGHNNYDENIELTFHSDGSYSYYRENSNNEARNFTGSFSINYGEVQMRDSADGGSYVLASDNDELAVGGSYYCDALGRVLTITSIEGGNLY